MKKIMLLHLIFISTLSACSNHYVSYHSQDTYLAEKILLREKLGELPVLESKRLLGGIDLNKNGIRDDIDAYIEQNFQTDQ